MNKTPLLNDEPKHRKKSKAKGRPRSKHKHEYKTVLLHSFVPHYSDKNKMVECLTATKVCHICGRLNGTDPEQYEKVEITPPSSYLSSFTENRIKNPESLEDWYCDFLARFAYKSKEEFLAEKEIRQENLNV